MSTLGQMQVKLEPSLCQLAIAVGLIGDSSTRVTQ